MKKQNIDELAYCCSELAMVAEEANCQEEESSARIKGLIIELKALLADYEVDDNRCS